MCSLFTGSGSSLVTSALMLTKSSTFQTKHQACKTRRAALLSSTFYIWVAGRWLDLDILCAKTPVARVELSPQKFARAAIFAIWLLTDETFFDTWAEIPQGIKCSKFRIARVFSPISRNLHKDKNFLKAAICYLVWSAFNRHQHCHLAGHFQWTSFNYNQIVDQWIPEAKYGFQFLVS